MRGDLVVEVLTRDQLLSKEEGADFLQILCNAMPEVQPQKYGWYEPLRRRFDPARLNEALEIWERGLFWRRSKPTFNGSVSPHISPFQEHAHVSLNGTSKGIDPAKTVRFIQQVASRFNADFALVHLLTPRECQRGGASETVLIPWNARNSYFFSLPSWKLRLYIPDLYWATVFGPTYIEHFSRERLLSAPAPVVRELGANHVYMQLSESLLDLQNEGHPIHEVREAVKRHLNLDSFFDPEKGIDYRYNVPDFRLPGKPRPPRPSAAEEKDRLKRVNEAVQGPYIQQMMTAFAEGAIDGARDVYGVELDYSVESIRRVEEILGKIHAERSEVSKELLGNIAKMFGGYIGEVLRRQIGAEWYVDQEIEPGSVVYGLRKGDARVFPPSKVMKRLTDGPGDDVYFYSQAMLAQLR